MWSLLLSFIGVIKLGKQKTFISFNDQVSLICNNKGIKINDNQYALDVLHRVGYFQLMVGYKHLFRIPNTNKYKQGTEFNEIVSLYNFDTELRDLFFKYLLQIERHLHSLMSYYFADKYGCDEKEYLNENNYNNSKSNHKIILKIIDTLNSAIRNADVDYIVHYRKKYNNVPLWIIINVVTFGNLSKMFHVFPQCIKTKVSKEFENLNQRQLEQFLSVLTKYRNVCAHGERLFAYKTVDAIADLPIHSQLSLPKRGNQYTKGKQDLFAVVIAFRYLLPFDDFIHFMSKLAVELYNIKLSAPHMDFNGLLDKMGFPIIGKVY